MTKERFRRRGSSGHRPLNPRTDFRRRGQHTRQKGLITPSSALGLSLATAIFVAAVVASNWQSRGVQRERAATLDHPNSLDASNQAQALPQVERAVAGNQVHSVTFSKCGVVRKQCVVDGDTFWLNGEKIRVADIDTPEVSQPRCGDEKALGERATQRLIVLLNQGPFELAAIGSRDEDQYGRKLRVVLRGGASLGEQLVAEGLARSWTGRRQPWC